MKRVLLDQGLAPRVAPILRERLWDGVHVSEIGLAMAEDIQILNFARQEHRICITLDHDFHAILARTRANQPSVVLLRIEKLNAVQQATLIMATWQICERELQAGAAVSADGVTVRLRLLPLTRS